MSVHLHPTAAREAPTPPPAPPARRDLTYGLGHVAGMLGVYEKPQPAIVTLIRLLIAQQGFPAPLPRARGTTLLTGAAALGTHARWRRVAVDAWFDGLLPPGARDALAAAVADETAATLDARADDLDALLAGRRA